MSQTDLASKPDLDELGSFSLMILSAVRCAEDGRIKAAWLRLRQSSDLFIRAGLWDENVADLYGIAAASIARASFDFSGELLGAHPAFALQLPELLPGATPAMGEMTPDGRCDYLVREDGNLRPVEIKRDSFRSAHIPQLRRYMNVYGAVFGYAAAPELACELPDDMIFIKLRWIL